MNSGSRQTDAHCAAAVPSPPSRSCTPGYEPVGGEIVISKFSARGTCCAVLLSRPDMEHYLDQEWVNLMCDIVQTVPGRCI